jgi:type VI protein secretion system component Hcp
MRRTFVAVLALTIANPVLLTGKPAPPQSEPGAQAINMLKIQGLSCSTPLGSGTFRVLSWSTGASNTGVASLSALAVTKLFDECSPALFGAVLRSQHFPTAQLTETDVKGVPSMTIQLADVVATNYQLVGDQASAAPAEKLSFAFARITITDVSTGATFCWDTRLRTPC